MYCSVKCLICCYVTYVHFATIFFIVHACIYRWRNV